MADDEQQFFSENEEQDYDPQFDEGPAVAESGAKNTAILIVGAALLIIIIIIIFSGGDDADDDKNKDEIPTEAATGPDVATQQRRVAPVDIPNINNGGGDKAPTFVAPPPPPPPPPPTPPPLRVVTPSARGGGNIGMGGGGQAFGATANLSAEQVQARIRSGMFISGGGGGGFGGFGGFGNQPNNGGLAQSSVATVQATITSDPYSTIGTGKIIDAVLETAINTLLPGMLRAVVSKDVYAERGKSILIPKGSRLLGSYKTNVSRGQARVMINWDRVIRPDGVDIALASPGADLLGRSGVLGEMDNRYFELFSSSVMLSSLTIGFAAVGDIMTGGGTIEEGETGSGNSTQSGDVKSIALLDAVTDFGNTVKKVGDELLDMRPLINIRQGTRLKVFVNKDITFPSKLASGIQVID